MVSVRIWYLRGYGICADTVSLYLHRSRGKSELNSNLIPNYGYNLGTLMKNGLDTTFACASEYDIHVVDGSEIRYPRFESESEDICVDRYAVFARI